jgi:ATP-dependent RNA helicase RhlB
MRRLPAPDQRLNLLFSATLAQRVLELAFEHMNDPELVRIEPDKMTVDRVRQVIYYPSMDEKPRLLVGLLKQMDPHRTMIFVNTRRGAEELETLLKANGFNAEAISGDVPQNKRLRMIRDFHSGELAILIGTDVASRGLHIPDVSHVFNYDLPQDPEDYVHRIGRKIPVAPVAQELLAEITVPRYERRRFSGPGGGGSRGGGGGRGGPRSGPPRSGSAGRGRSRSSAGGSGPRRESRPSPRPAPASAGEGAGSSPRGSAASAGEGARPSSRPSAASTADGAGSTDGAPRKRRRRGGRGRSGGAQGAGSPAPQGGDTGPAPADA